jgi:hypothetical protein
VIALVSMSAMRSIATIITVIGVINVLVGLWLPAARYADLPRTGDILHRWLDERIADGSLSVRPDVNDDPLRGLALKISRETDVESTAAGIIMGVQGFVLVGCGWGLGRKSPPAEPAAVA